MKIEWQPLSRAVSSSFRFSKDTFQSYDNDVAVNSQLLSFLIHLAGIRHFHFNHSDIPADEPFKVELIEPSHKDTMRRVWPRAVVAFNSKHHLDYVSASQNPEKAYSQNINTALKNALIEISAKNNLEITSVSQLLIDLGFISALSFISTNTALRLEIPHTPDETDAVITGIAVYSFFFNVCTAISEHASESAAGQPYSILPSIHPERHLILKLIAQTIPLTKVNTSTNKQ